MKDLIEKIFQKHNKDGIEIYPPASTDDIDNFERKIGFSLPIEFKEFYLTCNGFGCNEDIFNMIPLAQIISSKDYGSNWFYFSEYMIYADMWGLRITSTETYEIFFDSAPSIVMTTSLTEFLTKFLEGNVFDAGGLYDWYNNLRTKFTHEKLNS